MSRLSSMTLRVSHTSIDCHNAYELSGWWKQVLGQEDIPDDPNEPGSARRSSRIGEALYGPGTGWYVMADPEGNEFCILKSDAERAASLAGQ